jgi:hypothetical protein
MAGSVTTTPADPDVPDEALRFLAAVIAAGGGEVRIPSADLLNEWTVVRLDNVDGSVTFHSRLAGTAPAPATGEHKLAPTSRLINAHMPVYGPGTFAAEVVASCRCGVERAKDDLYGGWWAWHLAHALDETTTPADSAEVPLHERPEDPEMPFRYEIEVWYPQLDGSHTWETGRATPADLAARLRHEADMVESVGSWTYKPPVETALIGTWADPAFVAHQEHKHPVDGCGYCPTDFEEAT